MRNTILLLMVALVGCSETNQDRIEKTKVIAGGPTISTVDYDGHRFIWSKEYAGAGCYAGNLLHHPDCPCQK